MISSGDIAAAGSANVTVLNPAPGGGTSNAVSFAINNPSPQISAINPSSATAGGAAFTLTVTGAGFVPGSVVRWNGTDRSTSFGGSSQLTASIPASDIAAGGSAAVSVVQSCPRGRHLERCAFCDQ